MGEVHPADGIDAYLLSGLSNCGVPSDKEEKESAAHWADRLNDHHLFEEEEHAIAFSNLSDGRIPEHAPFYAYGIWHLPETTSA